MHRIQTKQKGFTIIEVLIVLAIAGLILLIVFLAVPALQRNSRNTQRHNDAASALGIINEYANNQNGTLPAVVCLAGTTFTAAGGTCAAQTNPANVSLSGQFTVVGIAALPATPPTNATAGTLQFYWSAQCNGNVLAPNPSGRAFVAWYSVEPGVVNQCRQS